MNCMLVCYCGDIDFFWILHIAPLKDLKRFKQIKKRNLAISDGPARNYKYIFLTHKNMLLKIKHIIFYGRSSENAVRASTSTDSARPAEKSLLLRPENKAVSLSLAEVAGELIGADGVIRLCFWARCELSVVMITLLCSSGGWRWLMLVDGGEVELGFGNGGVEGVR